MNIEEAIKICEKIIKNNNEIIKQARANKDINVMQLTADCDKESLAIEHLIQAYKDQEEKAEWFKRLCNKNAEIAQQLQSELEKKENIIDEYIRTFTELYNTIEIELTEDFKDDSYIFRAR